MQTNHFKNRVQMEKTIFSKELPQFKYNRTANERFFKGIYKTSARGNFYELKIVLGKNYPDEMPRMYISSPKTLWVHGENWISLNSEGCCHEYHTDSNSPEGYVQICHYNSETWHAAKTCTAIAFKGLIWCEAFDTHLTTGLSIAQIIENWEKCQKENRGDLTWLLKNTPTIDFSGIKLTDGSFYNPLTKYSNILSFKPEKKRFDFKTWQMD
jgi:hypothetical protein